MSSCEQVRRFLPMWVDGESTPLDEVAMRQHVDGCDACRRAELREREFRGALKAAFVVEPAPVGVLRRLFVRRHRAKLLAAAAMLAAVAAAPLLWRTEPSHEVVAQHEALASSKLPLDFTGDGALEQVRARLGLDVQLPALAQSKLKLRGARLDRESALFLFEDGGRPVTLAVQARRGPKLEGPPVFRTRRAGKYEVVSWDHGSLSYSLVSDAAGGASAGCAACHEKRPTPP